MWSEGRFQSRINYLLRASSGPGAVLQAAAVLSPGEGGLCLHGVGVGKCSTNNLPDDSTGKAADGQPLLFPGHWLPKPPLLGRRWPCVCGVEKVSVGFAHPSSPFRICEPLGTSDVC